MKWYVLFATATEIDVRFTVNGNLTQSDLLIFAVEIIQLPDQYLWHRR